MPRTKNGRALRLATRPGTPAAPVESRLHPRVSESAQHRGMRTARRCAGRQAVDILQRVRVRQDARRRAQRRYRRPMTIPRRMPSPAATPTADHGWSRTQVFAICMASRPCSAAFRIGLRYLNYSSDFGNDPRRGDEASRGGRHGREHLGVERHGSNARTRSGMPSSVFGFQPDRDGEAFSADRGKFEGDAPGLRRMTGFTVRFGRNSSFPGFIQRRLNRRGSGTWPFLQRFAYRIASKARQLRLPSDRVPSSIPAACLVGSVELYPSRNPPYPSGLLSKKFTDEGSDCSHSDPEALGSAI